MREQDFLNAVLQYKKTKLDLTIITAADKGYFTALQALIASIKSSHEVDIIVLNLGLTKLQILWIIKQNVKVIDITSSEIEIPKSVHFWQTWNKPCYFIQAAKHTNKKLFLWIDADCIVTNSLKWIDRNLLESQPIIFSDTAALLCCNNSVKDAKEVVSNSEELYVQKKYVVSERFEIDSYPNAGVVGLNLTRELDRDILKNWVYMIKEANKDVRLLDKTKNRWEDQRWLKWYDQGALQWAIEKSKATHKVINDHRFNDASSVRLVKNFNDTIKVIEEVKEAKSIKVIHFLAGSKPYNSFPRNFNPDTNNYPENRSDLQIFVLGHKKKEKLSYPCLEYVHLPDIVEDNDLAESRIFLTNKINNCSKKYIGLATAQWDTKYKNICCNLSELYKLPMRLDTVWCGKKALKSWYKYTNNVHSGMKRYLDYLVEELNIRNVSYEVPWSNNFIAHKSVVKDLHKWWWHCQSLLKIRFGNNIKYGMNGYDTTRIGAYIAERFSMLFFCMRDDLKYVQIPL